MSKAKVMKSRIHMLFHDKRAMQKWFTKTKLFSRLPDKTAIEILYQNAFYKKLDLENPQTFNEKLQWLKLYDRRPEYTTMVDKYEAKKYVSSLIGEEYVIPAIGVWDSAEEIDFDALPDQFVLKCTHASGDTVICTDKATFDREKAKAKLQKSLETDFYLLSREWPYKNVRRRILAEPLMKDDEQPDLRDYKFFTFGGEVKALFVASERQNKETSTKFDFFDADYQPLGIFNIHPNSEVLPPKPASFEKMKELAAVLAKGRSQLRVDFYEINGKPYVGELTLFHAGGLWPFEPEEWDYRFGAWLTLPEKHIEN